MISPTIEAFEGARYSIVRVFFAVLNLNVYLPPVALSVVELVHFELYFAFVVLSVNVEPLPNATPFTLILNAYEPASSSVEPV